MMNNEPKLNRPTSDSINNIQLNELFDLENLQSLQDLFAEAHHVASIITHPDGTPITQPSQFSRLCTIIRKTEKGCANCFKSDALLGRHHTSGPVVQPCLSGGLWDAGASITVNGQHVANWLIGQVRNDAVDEQSMLRYAQEIGADPDDFMEAFYEVPMMSVEQFTKVSKMLFAFANELSQKGYINLQLKRQMAERDIATALLKESEERFRSLFNKAPLGYQSLDVDGCFIEVNQQWISLLGYSREEVIGKWFGDFLAPAYQNAFRERFPIFKAQGNIHSEFEMVHKRGHILFIAFEGKIGYEQNGDFKQTHCILQDITERKKIEEALIKSEKHLIDSQTIAHLGTYAWDIVTGYWSSSKIMDEIFGIDQNYVRSLEGWTHIIHPEWQAIMAEYVINTVIGQQQPFDKEYKIIRQNDGQERWVHGFGKLELDSGNHPVQLIGTISDITERRQNEEALKESERLLRESQAIAHIGSFAWDFNGPIRWTDETYHIYGVAPETFTPTIESLIGLLHPEDRLPMQKWLEDCSAGLSPDNLEFRVIPPDGDIRILQGQGDLIVVNGKRNAYMIGTVQDITKRKQAEEILKDSLALLRIAEKKAKLGGWTVNLAENRSYWTDGVAAIHEMPPGYAPLLEDGINFYAPEWRDRITQVFTNCAQEGIPYDEEMEIITATGKRVWIQTIGEAVRNDIGKIIKVNGAFQDISERKRYEASLLESEQMLQTVLNNFPGVVFWKDTQSNYLGCNLAFAKGAGLSSSDEIIGKTDFDLPWADTEAENYRADDFEVMKSGKAKMHIIEMQHQAEGQEIWLETSKVPMIDSNKQVVGVIGVSTDITEMKQIQDIISTKNKELENYLYIASHDLRSPLVNIQGFSQRLQKQADTIRTLLDNCEIEIAARSGIDKITTIDIPKTLNFIFSNVAKMDTLINALLQISRTGQMVMNIQKVDINRLFHTILLTYNYQITELSAKVVVNELSDCYGDVNQLNQLFSNLIGNAIKYSDPNRQLVLEITSSINYNKVIYCIKDTGIGIAARHLEKIWEVFYQVDAGDSKSGEGIGLSLAKRIVDKHRGKIWAESEPDKGSVFYIELQQQEFTE